MAVPAGPACLHSYLSPKLPHEHPLKLHRGAWCFQSSLSLKHTYNPLHSCQRSKVNTPFTTFFYMRVRQTNYRSLCLRLGYELCSEERMRNNRIDNDLLPLVTSCPLENTFIPWLSAPALRERIMDGAKNHVCNLYLL